MAPIVPSAGYLQVVTKHEGVSLIAVVTKMKMKRCTHPLKNASMSIHCARNGSVTYCLESL